MPEIITKRCKIAGCLRHAATNKCGLCHPHLSEDIRQRKAKKKKRLKYPKDKQSDKFYHSRIWKQLRALFIADHPVCVKCGAGARVVDHIIPIKQGGKKLLVSNLQALCDRCHNKKRAQEQTTDIEEVNETEGESNYES